MGKVSFEVQEDNFVKKYTQTYDLSILIGVDRFCFLVSDPQQHLLLLRNYVIGEDALTIGSLEDAIKEIYISDKVLKLAFKRIRIGLMHEKNTFVPKALFDKDQQQKYLTNVVAHHPDDNVDFDALKSCDIINVHATNIDITNQLRGYFPGAHIYHGLSPVLLGFRKITEHQRGRQICLNVRDRLVQILLFDDKSFLFGNTFRYQSSKDFIYYVMLIFDQFQLKPEKDVVHIAGNIIENSEIYHLLYRYIRHLNIINAPSYYRFGKRFAKTPPHFYFDLFSLKLCG
ncbi:MAG: DUF3822 family protein [Bacteroidota bacterium]